MLVGRDLVWLLVCKTSPAESGLTPFSIGSFWRIENIDHFDKLFSSDTIASNIQNTAYNRPNFSG